ncbi:MULTISPECIES: DUF4326 domain-containing protein [Acidiphilium]|uniref:DUF4326 domain-containing protein n=1 Tax=Acidiphilium TaxID=522 RepID=UPI002587A96B|nr:MULTISPECIES: DUF4326 domain-containing protein [Acidiphilium]HQT85715.1 DUF4326 domain-containing protein [Acidiphilium rubrum]
MSVSLETAPRSHRPHEAQEHYLRRLARARLKRSELREIETLYARLDADRAAHGLPPAERPEWSPVDILEWQDLNATERYLDLETYALAADRATQPQTERITLQPIRTYRVLNKSNYARQLPADAVYIGRGSKWGNPFVIGRDGTREEVTAKHEYWLSRQNDLLRTIDELKGRDLVCYCSPLACHGQILLKLANASRDDRIAWWKQMRVAH